MKLDNPITIELGSGEPVLLNELDVVLMDHKSRKLVLAKVHLLASPLPLWRGSEYDEVGDYTQAQAEDRVKELLGPNLEQLQNLFNREIIQ